MIKEQHAVTEKMQNVQWKSAVKYMKQITIFFLRMIYTVLQTITYKRYGN